MHARESLSGLRKSPDCLGQTVSRNLNFKDIAGEGSEGSKGHVMETGRRGIPAT